MIAVKVSHIMHCRYDTSEVEITYSNHNVNIPSFEPFPYISGFGTTSRRGYQIIPYRFFHRYDWFFYDSQCLNIV